MQGRLGVLCQFCATERRLKAMEMAGNVRKESANLLILREVTLAKSDSWGRRA